MTEYIKINEHDIPKYVRFDIPARFAGQTIEVSYGGYSKYVHDEGAPFKREIDRSTNTITYYASRFEFEAMSNTAGT